MKVLKKKTRQAFLGRFQSESFAKEFGSKGVVGEDCVINIKIKHLPEKDRDWLLITLKLRLF